MSNPDAYILFWWTFSWDYVIERERERERERETDILSYSNRKMLKMNRDMLK